MLITMKAFVRLFTGSVIAAVLFCQPVSGAVDSADDLHPLRPNLTPDRGVSVVTGSSVDIGNGTYTFTETDLRVPAKGIPITFERTYRSNQIMKGRDDKDWQFAAPLDTPLGFGWYSPWFARVTSDGSYLDGQGNFMYFERDANGAYLPDPNSGLTLRWTGNGFELFKRGEGITLLFNSEGNLKQIKDEAGNSVTLIYTAGKPSSVKDVLGRTVLTFAYNSRGRLQNITDLAGRSITYDHDGADNLTKATLTLPGGQPIVLGSYDYDLTNYSTLPMTCTYNTSTIGGVRKTVTTCTASQLPPADQFGTTCVNKEWWDDGIQYTESYCYAIQYTNSYHGLIKKTDVAGNSYSIDYYPKWRNKGIVRSVTDPQNRITTFTNDFAGRTFVYTDYSGRTFRKILNDKGQLIQLVEILPGNIEQQLTKIEYLDNRTTKTTDALGNATSEQKDEWGNTIKRTDADGFEWRSQYDATGRQIMAIDPLGTTTRYEYDAAGNRTKEIQAAGTPDESVTSYTYSKYRELLTTTANGAVTAYAYDDGGNLTAIIDPEQNVTTMTYDAAGNLLSRTVPLIGSSSYANHDWKGNPRTISDPNGTITTNSYDIAGRILTTTTDNATTTYGYTPVGGVCTSCSGATSADNGKIAYIVLPEGNRIDYGYDANGNLTTITDQDGNRIVYSYDGKGNKIREEIKDQSGILHKTQSQQYDLLSRLSKTINPDNGETVHGYDKRGNLIALTNANNATTSYSYDQANRLIKVTQGDVQTTYTYDRRNNLTAVTDANGNATAYEYDKQNRLTKTTSPDTGITTYTYDNNGNLKTRTDAKNITAAYTYDAASRLTKITFPDPVDNVSYAYDSCINSKGRLCAMQDPSGTTSYEYTKKGQIQKETITIDNQTFTTEYGYDKNGNVTSMKYPSGRTISYSYANDKVTQISNNETPIATSISYKPFGGLSNLTFGNGIQQTNTYDQQYRLTSITANNIQNMIYGYDKNGNITGITDILDAGKTKTYGYDALDRLTQASGPWGNLTYTYDKVGNRKSENHNDVTTSYGYKPSSNQLTTVAGEKNYGFGYDTNGNTNTENARQYIYNQNQRLIRVTEQVTTKDEQGLDITTTTTKGEYVYNANGQRSKKATAAGSTYFVFDQQGKQITESGATSVDYVFLDSSPLAKLEGRITYYIHTDHLGTPQNMTDSVKQITWEISAMPFGETLNITGQAANNLRFPGQRFDGETGLHYNYFRDYKPDTGRYIQSDPLGINEGNNHLFLYVQNNSINKTDPQGLDSPGCDVPRWAKRITGANSCFLECCAKHDKCYHDNACSCKSWSGNFLGGILARISPCVRCNDAAVSCFIRCKTKWKPKNALGKYYCGVHDVWFDDPNSSHMSHSTDNIISDDIHVPVS